MVRASYDQVMAEMERTKQQVLEEQNRRLAVESELRIGTASQRTLIEVRPLNKLSFGRCCSVNFHLLNNICCSLFTEVFFFMAIIDQ